jgi:hypothetical protein
MFLDSVADPDRICRARMFLGLLDSDQRLVRGTDPDPSIIKLKNI